VSPRKRGKDLQRAIDTLEAIERTIVELKVTKRPLTKCETTVVELAGSALDDILGSQHVDPIEAVAEDAS
jgi:hypothetical protein